MPPNREGTVSGNPAKFPDGNFKILGVVPHFVHQIWVVDGNQLIERAAYVRDNLPLAITGRTRLMCRKGPSGPGAKASLPARAATRRQCRCPARRRDRCRAMVRNERGPGRAATQR